MTDSDTIQRTIVLPAPRERVWKAITQPAELSQWFASQCEFTLEIGSPITLTWANGEISRGVIEAIDPPHRFTFRWHAKPTAYSEPLVPENSTVVTFTLEAVDSGHIAGACLDVFRVEPLPEDHPFWRNPKIIVTPHTASLTNPKLVAPQIIENYRKVQRGEPLINVVNVARGY